MKKGILSHLLEFRSKYFMENGSYPSHVSVSKDEFVELLSTAEFVSGPHIPRPPVLEKTTITTSGFFGSKQEKTVIYDNNNRDYVESLSRYKKDRINFYNEFPNGKIFGMKIIVEGQNEIPNRTINNTNSGDHG